MELPESVHAEGRVGQHGVCESVLSLLPTPSRVEYPRTLGPHVLLLHGGSPQPPKHPRRRLPAPVGRPSGLGGLNYAALCVDRRPTGCDAVMPATNDGLARPAKMPLGSVPLKRILDLDLRAQYRIYDLFLNPPTLSVDVMDAGTEFPIHIPARHTHFMIGFA